jgi:hypothetical protein
MFWYIRVCGNRAGGDDHAMCQPCPLSETIKRKFFAIALGLLISNAVFCPQVFAATLEIPLALDYRILEQALREQVFSGPETTAEVFADQIRCNILVLSEPSIAATDDGQVRVLASMQARFGTPIAGKCRGRAAGDGFTCASSGHAAGS